MATITTITQNLSGAENTIVNGSGFSPALQSEPASVNIYDSDGNKIENGIKIQYYRNGDYWDLIIFSADPYTNAKIKVIC